MQWNGSSSLTTTIQCTKPNKVNKPVSPVSEQSQLTVNSSHGKLVTCDEFTFSPKSELVTVNSSQRLSQVKWTRHTVNSSHWRRGDLVTQNPLLSSQRLSQHLPHRFTHSWFLSWRRQRERRTTVLWYVWSSRRCVCVSSSQLSAS